MMENAMSSGGVKVDEQGCLSSLPWKGFVSPMAAALGGIRHLAFHHNPCRRRKPSDASIGAISAQRLKGTRLFLTILLALSIHLSWMPASGEELQGDENNRANVKSTSICSKAEKGSLLQQICDLEGSSRKMHARFDSRFLPGGATTQLVIGRKYEPDEALEFRGLMVWNLTRHKSPTVRTRELNILSVEKGEYNTTLLTIEIPRIVKLWPYLGARFMVAAYPKSNIYPKPGAVPQYVTELQATVSSQFFPVLMSVLLVALLYMASAMCFGKGHRKWSLVGITAGFGGRGSLSKFQIFFFTFVVIYLLTYTVLRTGELCALSTDVLLLLGISAAGTAGAKATAVNRKQLDPKNWAWLALKGVQAEPDTNSAGWGDLLLTGKEFDVSKFQMLAFNLVVAVALLLSGLTGLANFAIPGTLLGLLGLSQVVYLGGKVIPANPYGELNRMTKELRDLESKFVETVAAKWKASPPEKRSPSEERNLDTAKAAAPDEYAAYKEVAEKLVTVLKSVLGEKAGSSFNTEPGVPE